MEAKTIEYSILKDIVKEKWKRFLLFGIIMLIISLIIAFTIPKQYTSNVMFQVKPRGSAQIAGNSALAALAGINSGDSSLTYMSILKSSRVLEPVIQKLDIPDEDKEQMTADIFAKKYLTVDNPRGTDILTFSIEADSPEEAQTIAQNVTESFQLALSDLSGAQDSGMVKLLSQKTDAAKKDLEQKVQALENYKQGSGVYAPSDQEKMLLEKSAGYDKAKAEAEVQLNTNSAIVSNMESQLSDQNAKVLESKMADNPEIQEIRNKLLNANQNLAALRFKFTDTYPEVIKAQENVNFLNQQLDATVSKAVRSENVSLSAAQSEILKKRIVAKSNADAAQASIDTLKALAEQNKLLTNEFSAKSIEFFKLERDVNIAKETYTTLVKTTESLKMKENLDSMDVRIVDKASLPIKHSWPKRALIVLAGGFIYALIIMGYLYIGYSRRVKQVI